MERGRARSIIAILVYLGSATLLLNLLWRHWNEIHEALRIWPSVSLLGLSVAFKIIFHCWQVLVSKRVLALIGCEQRYGEVFKLVTLPQLVAYIPGKVMSYVNLVDLGRSMGIALDRMAVFVALSQLITIVLSLLYGSAALFFLPSLSGHMRYAPLLALAIVILMNPAAFNWLSIKVFGLIGRSAVTFNARVTDLAALFSVSLVGYFVEGLSFAAFVAAFVGLQEEVLLTSLFLFALARIVGYLSIVFPAGIGIREGVLIVALSRFMNTEIATVITVASRMLEMAVLGGLSAACFLLRNKTCPPMTSVEKTCS